MIWKSFYEFYYGVSIKQLIVLMKPVKVSFICLCLFHLTPSKQHRIIKTCVFHGEQSYPLITITPTIQNMAVKCQIHCSM